MHFSLRVAALIGALLFVTEARRDVLVFGPNIIRLDAEETVVVTMLGQAQRVQASVYLQDYPSRKKTYPQQAITLEKDKPVKVSVKVKSSEFSDIKTIEVDQQRYLNLVVESKDKRFKFKRESKLLVQASSGYVFIQTDKPIYNPRQQVHIRVLPVDQSLKLSEIPVRVEILNPQDIIVERKNYPPSKKYIVHTHTIVDNPMMGNWTVRASYGKDNKSFTSVPFEVREYILPVFEVIVRVNRYILPETKQLKGTVEARYLHGKPVKGTAKVYIFMLLDGKTTALGNVKRKQLVRGLIEYNLDLDDILQPMGLGGFPDGGRLILNAEVTESATYNRESKEDRSCLFVRSPYKISLVESSRFFKPSLVYEVRVKAEERGAGPAKDLKVQINLKEKKGNKVERSRDQELQLDGKGRGIAGFGLLNNVNQLEITVVSNDDKYPNNPGKAVLVAEAYKSPSNRYLAVRCDKTIGTVNGHLNLEFVVPANANQISAFNIMIISRGRVVYTKKLKHHAGLINTDTVTVTQDMVPSIRVVGYYIVGTEIVADSLWIDIEDECGSEVVISSNQEQYLPDEQGVILLNGEPGTTVGLSMVDAAVFLLNDRHLLTRKKMFDVLDKFDLGCGPGGGRDSSDVFMTSGLSLVSSGLTTTARYKLTCDGALGRQRREADSPRPGKVTQRQICCSDGAKVLNGSMCFTEATAHKNATRACRQEFFRCCRRRAKCMAGNCRPEGRSSGGIDDIMNMDIDESEELTPRSNFKESTLLQSYVIGQSGKKSVHVTLPSSITKWMVQGVTISPTSGMCIANPYNITVFKEFYIDVRIPLKAVRGEQLEVKVTIYNFQRIDTKVKVYLYGVKGLCSEALPGEKSSPRFLRILRNDAATTSFPILPLELGQYPIKVVAYTTIGSDAVQKTLLVVPEGKRITVPAKSIVLDPQGVLAGKGLPDRNRRNAKLNAKPVKEEIDVTVPANIIKGTESCTASITGNIVGHSVEASIKGVSDMLAIPRGCGEQTMIRMAPTVYAMSYLSQTSPDLKGIEAKGHKLIQQGYTRQLTFRKSDGSFAVWSKHPSSTWLTAFVLKVFCQAQEFVNIDQKVISSGLAWLQTTQRQDGRFKEKYRVHHQEMIGGVKEDVSLTAFVLITLRECHAGQPGNAPGELEAIRFLEGQLERIKDLYTKAIVTYALSLTSSEKTQRANELLRQGAVYNKAKSIRYWPAGGENSALAVEATSYALMAQLELRDQKYTHAIVNWLTQKRNSKGAFKSTQDTVVGLQAITKYSIETFVEEIDLECSLASEANAEFNEKVKITKEDALVQRRVKRVPIGGKLIVETKGTGVGQLQVDISYNVPTKKDELCKFELIVDCTDVKFVVDGDRENCDVCGECEEKDDGFVDYDYDLLIIPGARSARGNKEHAASSPRRSRIGRQAARIGGAVRKQPRNNAEGGVSKTVVCINIRVSSLTGSDTGMSIIDVGLFTGFSPFKGDLDQLKTSNTIDSYEINDGRVILYLPKIPKKDPAAEPLSVKFRARQDLRVGNIQPASVKVFYYYEPDEVSCTEFYRPDDKSPVYETICIGDACKCAEGHCPKCYEEKEKLALTRNDLMSIACNDVDYVYEVKVTEVKEDVKAMGLLQRRISVDLQEILKPGSDRLAVEGSHIDLWITLSCGHCPLMEEGKKYLVMARDGPVENGRRKYALDESAFVMEFYDRADRRLAMPVRRLGNQMILFKRAIGTGCAK